MVVSLLGSGFAGLLSYNKAGDRVLKMRTLEKLLELAKAARTADTIQALEELQGEIDTIQAAMIREIETGALDGPAMMAHTMSIERALAAISDRRTTLAGLPPRPLAAVASL
jgi:hypothetical protein